MLVDHTKPKSGFSLIVLTACKKIIAASLSVSHTSEFVYFSVLHQYMYACANHQEENRESKETPNKIGAQLGIEPRTF